MSKQYEKLLRKRGEIEVKFTKLKAWFMDQRVVARKSHLAGVEFDNAMDELESVYLKAKAGLIEEKNLIESDIYVELDVMNHDLEPGKELQVFRHDGRIDFGKAFLFLVKEISGLKKLIQEVLVKEIFDMKKMIQKLSV